MDVKVILYILVTPLVIWAFDGVDMNRLFKKNRISQAIAVNVMFVLAISYLVVNFLYDFFIYVKFV